MNFKRLLASVSVVASFGALSLAALPAQAATQQVTFYISAPRVQGSYLNTGGDVSLENFDAGCNTTWSMGTITPSCTANDAGLFGGAVTETSTPVTTTGGVGTKYLGISSGNSITLTLTTASRYVGFYWSGGDANNTIDFYKGDLKLITITTADIEAALANATITAQNNDVYNTYEYYGNPNIEVAANEAGKSALSPFAYVHLMLSGGASFDKIVMSQVGGGGFELDNFLTKVSLPSVDTSLAKVSDTPLENQDPDAPAEESSNLADTGLEANGFAGTLALIALISGAGALVIARKQNS